MKKFFLKIYNGTKIHQGDIILVIGVILISLLSFAVGYIIAKQEEKQPIQIEYEQPESYYYWSWNLRAVSGLEIS